MELKKLYGDLTVLIGTEVPTYSFLLYCDMGVRTLLGRYPKKLLLPVGEYCPPETLSDVLPIAEEFYTALLWFIGGSVRGEENMLKKSETAAEEAYRTLWRAAARGKRRKGDVW